MERFHLPTPSQKKRQASKPEIVACGKASLKKSLSQPAETGRACSHTMVPGGGTPSKRSQHEVILAKTCTRACHAARVAYLMVRRPRTPGRCSQMLFCLKGPKPAHEQEQLSKGQVHKGFYPFPGMTAGLCGGGSWKARKASKCMSWTDVWGQRSWKEARQTPFWEGDTL